MFLESSWTKVFMLAVAIRKNKHYYRRIELVNHSQDTSEICMVTLYVQKQAKSTPQSSRNISTLPTAWARSQPTTHPCFFASCEVFRSESLIISNKQSESDIDISLKRVTFFR